MMKLNPFQDSQILADWTASTLMSQGLDEIAYWRMLEYWMQVELYRAIQAGQADPWRHIGDYEHPYHTGMPLSGSKTQTKWIDLVLAEPSLETPESVVWIELKDIGRNEATTLNKAKSLGHDLAALWSLDPQITKDIWLKPNTNVMSKDRFNKEWSRYGQGLECKIHRISQIVLCHKELSEKVFPKEIKKQWIQSFEKKIKSTQPAKPLKIEYAETSKFHVYALVGQLGQ